MQLTRIAAVFIATALPAIASAALCTEETSTKAPADVLDQFNKFTVAVEKAVTEAMPEILGASSRLARRAYGTESLFKPMECMLLSSFCYLSRLDVVSLSEERARNSVG